MRTPYGKYYALYLQDVNANPVVQQVLASSFFARMRRPAINETYHIALPAIHYDMFRIASALSWNVSKGIAVNLPFRLKPSDPQPTNLGLINYNTFPSESFSNLQSQTFLFPYSPLITPLQSGFVNKFSANFKPVILPQTYVESNHPYYVFNTLLHKAIIQPGVLLQPYIYNHDLASTDFFRTFGPIILQSCTINGDNAGNLTFNTNFVGATAFSGDLYSEYPGTYPIPAAREANLTDVRIVIDQDAEQYFNSNDLFLETTFVNNYSNYIYQANQGTLDDPKKRVVSWSLTINNTYSTQFTMPGNTSVTGFENYENQFIAFDSAGQRFFTHTARSVTGQITFLYDQIVDFEYDFFADNTDTHRLIISIAPNFHFPLTNVQFDIGEKDYYPNKSVKVTYSFFARISQNANLSLVSYNQTNPTSEFGYSYNIYDNVLRGAD